MASHDLSAVLTAMPDGVTVRVKVVPGASRTKVAGVLGDRLKVTVAAPAEVGKANAAVCELLAEVFGVVAREVVIAAGETRREKRVEVLGVSLCEATERLGRWLEESS